MLTEQRATGEVGPKLALAEALANALDEAAMVSEGCPISTPDPSERVAMLVAQTEGDLAREQLVPRIVL